jgi:hypothetical protein
MKYLTRSRAAALVLLTFGAVACKRNGYDASDPLAASLIFDNGSPEAREALATPVDFRLTDENFARWEQAQDNLDDLPRAALRSEVRSGRNAIDRAVIRLESNPRARRAVESAGLSVRDFVLETIALAQAMEAAETGKSTSAAPVPPDNFQFVQRYRSRILLVKREDRLARDQAEAYDMRVDTAESSHMEMNMQTEESDAGHASEMSSESDTASARDTTHNSASDTIPVPRYLLLPARQRPRNRWRGELGDAGLERLELRIVHDQRVRTIELRLRNELLRSYNARLLERVRREPPIDYRRFRLSLLQQDLKQIRDSLRVVARARHIHDGL